MSEEINFKDLYKTSTTVLEGDFPVVVDKVVHDRPSQSGKPMLRCTLKITGGPFVGRTIMHNFTISPDSPVAMSIFFKSLASLGADEKFFGTNPTLESVAAQITGRHAIVTLKKGTWGDNPREEVVKWAKATGAPVTVASSLPTAQSLPTATTLPAAQAVTVNADTAPPEDPFSV